MYSYGHTTHQTILNFTPNTQCGASILTLHSYSVFDISCTRRVSIDAPHWGLEVKLNVVDCVAINIHEMSNTEETD
jgi:hypothetical protein